MVTPPVLLRERTDMNRSYEVFPVSWYEAIVDVIATAIALSIPPINGRLPLGSLLNASGMVSRSTTSE